VPYLVVAGAELEPEYEKWLSKMLPQAAVTVWPASGHLPHLATPAASLSASPPPAAHPARHRATNSQHDQPGPGTAATCQKVQSAASICDQAGLPCQRAPQCLSARQPLPAGGLVNAAAHRTGSSVPRLGLGSVPSCRARPGELLIGEARHRAMIFTLRVGLGLRLIAIGQAPAH
jgi:hypothetical protein